MESDLGSGGLFEGGLVERRAEPFFGAAPSVPYVVDPPLSSEVCSPVPLFLPLMTSHGTKLDL